jgi:hypothetical protein
VVFSNSFARRLLADAFEVLHAETPLHHDELCAALVSLPVTVEIGDERLAPVIVAGGLTVADARADARVTISTSLAATLALLDARHTLVESIHSGAIDVRGTAEALDAAAGAFTVFLHGLVRAPSGPRLLEQLRREVGNGQ